MTDKPVIGFIGVGFMGHGMAKNILKGGYDLWVKGNRNRAPVESLVGMGAKEAATAKEMAENCDVIHICLSNSPQVEAVFYGDDGLLAGARDGLTVIETSTADPTSTQTLAAALAEKGGIIIDAPLGRTPKEAEEGTLDAMVGASDEDFKRVLPIIECWASTINHVGPMGSGHKMKLMMNFISMGYAAFYSEALSVAAKVGLHPKAFAKVIGDSRLNNGFFQTFMAYAIDRDDEIHKFSITNATKDLRYFNTMANEAGALNVVGSAVKHYFTHAEATGRGGDFVIKLSDIVGDLNGIDMAAEVAKTR